MAKNIILRCISDESRFAPRVLSAPHAVHTSRREWLALVAILIAGICIRLPFWPMHRDLGDALNYAIGALYTHVAHPPGSVGYCLLIGWVNDLFHRIELTLVLVSLVASLIATFVCHRLAKAMSMTAAASLVAACLYYFSITTLTTSLFGTPHQLEGLASLLLGWLAWKAIRDQRLIDALLATFVFASAGALRPTTTMLLAPLWLLMLWHTLGGNMTARLWRITLHLLIAVPIVALWSWGNTYYMAYNGYGGQTFQNQVLINSTYDFANMATTARNSATPHLMFHMPGAEMLAWIEARTGVRLMPHVPGWPTASLSRALHLLIVQTAKQGWWLLVSLPIIVVLPVMLIGRRGRVSLPGGAMSHRVFFSFWIAPPVLFYMFGHMGVLFYLQIYLGAACLWIAALLFPPAADAAPSPRPELWRRFATGSVAACLAFNIAFFTVARPFQASGGIRRGLDLVLLQFDGYSRRHDFTTSRYTDRTESIDQMAGDSHDYIAAPNDAALVLAARRNHFSYMRPADWLAKPNSTWR